MTLRSTSTVLAKSYYLRKHTAKTTMVSRGVSKKTVRLIIGFKTVKKSWNVPSNVTIFRNKIQQLIDLLRPGDH